MACVRKRVKKIRLTNDDNMCTFHFSCVKNPYSDIQCLFFFVCFYRVVPNMKELCWAWFKKLKWLKSQKRTSSRLFLITDQFFTNFDRVFVDFLVFTGSVSSSVLDCIIQSNFSKRWCWESIRDLREREKGKRLAAQVTMLFYINFLELISYIMLI